MAVPESESLWLWLGTAGMTLGTLAFVAMGWNEQDEQKQTYYIVTIFIAAIAATSYFSMASGFGVINIPNHEEPIYWARYADWLFTTPLLLLDLALLAGASRNTIFTLVGLDAAMIVTGLGGALATEGMAYRLAWWGISCGFFLVLLYFLVGKLSAAAAEQSGDVAQLFGTLRNLTLVLWTAYPIVWLIGTEGLGLVGIYPETAIFMVLDLSAKVGFGFLLLRSHTVLDQVTTGAVAAGD
ncbi:bacteriorhodopsin [Haloarchaeobius amylolyticus]|uniref:bacteriorhodopsin n=1 Tax=Haloarchaeobius amylolyticus TaxID=1198296 RepID=UPI00226E43C4|nr:bacteriorhodopsin [Haloarchaeobius amylolyticus]